nr:hypothetical protein [Tanacetum cinerariifolium]
MSTSSSARNLFPPLDNPELTIRRRSRADPTLLNDFEMAAEGNNDPPVPNLQTMEELCQASLNGRAQRSESSSSITSSSDPKIVALKAEMTEINKNLMRVLQVNQQVKAVTPNCETCGGPHSYNDCPTTVGQTQNVYLARAYQELPEPKQKSWNSSREQPRKKPENDAILKNMQTNMTSLTNSNLELKNMFGQFMKMNTASSSWSGTLLCNTVTNPKEDLKGITTRSGTAYQGPMIPITFSSLPKVVKFETEVTKDMAPPTNNGSTKDVQPSVVQTETSILNSEPVVALVSASKPNQKP